MSEPGCMLTVAVALLMFTWMTTTGLQLNMPIPVRVNASTTAPACSKSSRLGEGKTNVSNILRQLFDHPFCGCGHTGNWTRVVRLNMADLNHTCPSNWTFTTSPIRGRGRSSSEGFSCDSMIYSMDRNYSSVCVNELEIRICSSNTENLENKLVTMIELLVQ